jgi:hypothetical protein
MADIFGEWKRYKAERRKKIMDIILLLSVLGALQQLQIRIGAEASFTRPVDQLGCLLIAPLDPDEYVRVKYH